MRKSLHLIWATALTACVPVYIPGSTCTTQPKEQAAWEAAAKANTAKAYKSYLAQYPKGCYVDQATAKLRSPVVPPEVKKVKTTQKGGGGGGAGGIY